MTLDELAQEVCIGKLMEKLGGSVSDRSALLAEAVMEATREHMSEYPTARACTLGPKCRADIAQRAARRSLLLNRLQIGSEFLGSFLGWNDDAS